MWYWIKNISHWKDWESKHMTSITAQDVIKILLITGNEDLYQQFICIFIESVIAVTFTNFIVQ